MEAESDRKFQGGLHGRSPFDVYGNWVKKAPARGRRFPCGSARERVEAGAGIRLEAEAGRTQAGSIV